MTTDVSLSPTANAPPELAEQPAGQLTDAELCRLVVAAVPGALTASGARKP